MAPHNTNVEKQAKRHSPALIGIAASVLFGLVVFAGYFFIATDPEDEPAEEVEVPAVE